jgi:hypothetical protein
MRGLTAHNQVGFKSWVARQVRSTWNSWASNAFDVQIPSKEISLSRVIYRIVEHAGGWAYQVQGTYSETFSSADAARAAARLAAAEQAQPGKDVGITFEDAAGRWHEELSHGDDRPDATVEG